MHSAGVRSLPAYRAVPYSDDDRGILINQNKTIASRETYRGSPVTCHMSLTPTATASDHPPAISPTLCTSGWFLKTKKPFNFLAWQFMGVIRLSKNTLWYNIHARTSQLKD